MNHLTQFSGYETFVSFVRRLGESGWRSGRPRHLIRSSRRNSPPSRPNCRRRRAG
ncbi:MAG: hypothetical protein OJF58_003043 [Enhydrobacter sp.]|nr:MAG: hypothetical protein OJF58_003043 [Enhydrobacter sp.]